MDLLNLYAKIGVDSTEFNKGMENVQTQSNAVEKALEKLNLPLDDLQDGMSSAKRPTNEVSDSFETQKNKLAVLQNNYSDARKKVQQLTDAFNESARESGTSSESTKDLTEQLDKAEKEAAQAKDELDKCADSIKKQGDAADDASSKTGSFADKLKSGFSTAGKVVSAGVGAVATAATGTVAALLSVEESTEEYRIAQGKLNTAYESAGYSAETANKQYTEFYKILGDTDTATEASQLLAKLSLNAEDMGTWTDIAAGVWGTFGDSLPIEGLIESANETAKVGEVTGSLADALNWAGISEDDFNEKLAACTDESDRNQLIMDTLSGTYDEASDAFYKNNEALVESRSNQALLDETLANLGETVSDIKNNLMSEFLPAISDVTSAFGEILQGTEGADEKFSLAIQSLIDKVVEKLPEFLNMGVQILTAIISGIVQNIPTLIAMVPQLIEQIGAALAELFPQVLDMGIQILGQIASGIETELPNFVARLPQIIDDFLNYLTSELPTILDKGVEILNSLVNGIINSIPKLVSSLPKIITSITSFISKNLPKIVNSGINILKNLVSGIIKAIPSLVASIPKIISAIVEAIKSHMSTILGIGKNIVQGIWNGISNSISWLWNKITGWMGGLIDNIKSFLGIASPSKVFAGIGGYMAEGLGKGWDDEYSSVKKQIENGMNFTADVSVKSRTHDNNNLLNGYGNNVTFNINAAEYSNINELVNKIEYMLEKKTSRRKNVYV